MLEEYVRPIPRNPQLSDEERMRMSEENRRAAHRRADDPDAQGGHAREIPEQMQERRGSFDAGYSAFAGDRVSFDSGRTGASAAVHAVPSHEELVARFRADQERARAAAEAARLTRMQQSAANRDGRAYAATAGSSAVKLREDEEEKLPARITEPEDLPEPDDAVAPERPDASQIAAYEGGRYSMGRKSSFYPKRMNTVRTVLVGIVAVALIGMVIYGKVQANELYTKVRRLQAQYDDLTAQNISMRSEMEGKMTVKNIAEYAENVLGLKPLDQSQIQYVQIQTEDEVTITEPETNWLVAVNDFLNDIWNFFRGA